MKPTNPNLIPLEIESGILIPDSPTNPPYRRKPTYNLRLSELEIGQSVFIPETNSPPLQQISKLKLQLGRLFAIRKYFDEKGKILGIRVWRTH
jgi:hypothetical protein